LHELHPSFLFFAPRSLCSLTLPVQKATCTVHNIHTYTNHSFHSRQFCRNQIESQVFVAHCPQCAQCELHSVHRGAFLCSQIQAAVTTCKPAEKSWCSWFFFFAAGFAKLKRDFVPTAPTTMALPCVRFFLAKQSFAVQMLEVQTIRRLKSSKL